MTFTNLIFMFGQAPGAAAGQGGSNTSTFLFMGLIFVVSYFFMIRPQNVKRKQREAMLKSMAKGDKVVSIGGVRGIISKLENDSVWVKVDDGVKIEFSRNAISEILIKDGQPVASAAPAESNRKESKKDKKTNLAEADDKVIELESK